MYVLEEVLVLCSELIMRIESKRELVVRTSVRTQPFERESEYKDFWTTERIEEGRKQVEWVENGS